MRRRRRTARDRLRPCAASCLAPVSIRCSTEACIAAVLPAFLYDRNEPPNARVKRRRGFARRVGKQPHRALGNA